MATKIVSFICALLLVICSSGAAVLDANNQPDPTDARMSLWLKADDGVTGTQYGSEMLVTQWTNKSANTFNAVAPPGREPLKTTDNIGGSVRDVVYFNDTGPRVEIADDVTGDKLDPETSNFYIFFVGRGVNYEAVIYSHKGGAGSGDEHYRLYQCCEAPGEYRVRFGTGCDLESCKAGTLIAGTAENPVTTTYAVLTAALEIEGSQGTAKGWLNGDPAGWTAGAAGAGDDVLDIGDGINTANEWYMQSASILGRGLYAAELLIYKGTLSSSERQDIEQYLLCRYNLFAATYPSPADGGEDAEPNVTLSWKPGPGALSHDVYFGTDFNDVNDANTSSAVFKGNQTATIYDPCGTLSWYQTYYWRIDEVYSGDTVKGNVWQFTTIAADAIFETTLLWQQTGDHRPGYHLPAIIDALGNSDLLAFAEKWIDGHKAYGNHDVAMKRSTDKGKTWGSDVVLYTDSDTISDPTIVVDSNTGRICLFFLIDKRELDQSTYTKFSYMYSNDNGNNWTGPISIHDDVVNPDWAIGIVPDQRFGVGPGAAGICKKYPPHAGRLIVPARHREKIGSNIRSFSHIFYSDDHGSTWQLGGTVHSNEYFSTECQLVELDNGDVMINMRHADSAYGPDNYRRLVAISSDGGESWGTVYRDLELIGVRCHASITRHTLASEHDRNRILFSNPKNDYRTPYHPYGRYNMSVRVSYDEGETWSSGKTIWPYPSSYSDLVVLDDMTIGLVYERGPEGSTHYWDEIQFARFNLEWLTNGQDRYPYSDITGDGRVDLKDFSGFASCWNGETSDPLCVKADLSGDEEIDINDLWFIAHDWLLSQAN